MGKPISFYASEEVADCLADEENKSDIINNLILEYFNEDEEYIKREVKRLEERLSYLYQRLVKIEESKLEEYKKNSLNKEKKEEQEKEQSIIEKWKTAFNSGIIDYGTYFEPYNEKDHKFNIEEVKLKIEELNIK